MKDHKKTETGKPIPMRSVCGSYEANNTQLSNMLAEIVNSISELMDKEIKTVCRSTEEMISEIEKVNGRNDIKSLSILSTDVSAMYPSLNIDVCAKVVADEFYNSGLEINVDEVELALYLAVTVDRDEIVSLGLDEVVHTRIHNRGQHPGITTEEILKRSDTKTKTKFNLPVRKPTNDEVRKMFAKALEVSIKAAMSEHIYSFNNQLKKQADGGAIGNVLTGALATCYMLYWARLFVKKVNIATRICPLHDENICG